MFRLSGGQVESLFDVALPVEVRELPEDLARLDGLLERSGVAGADRAGVGRLRRAIVGGRRSRCDRFVRLMVIKQRTGWGYETLVREVSDSLHLRRFCLIALSERVPDESTVRKLVRRLGAEVIDEIARAVIAGARARAAVRRRGRRASTRRWSRPTFAIRQMPGWRSTRARHAGAEAGAVASSRPRRARVRDRSRASAGGCAAQPVAGGAAPARPSGPCCG